MSTEPTLQTPPDNIAARHTAALGSYESAVATSLQRLGTDDFLSRFWKKDPTLWKAEPEHQPIIANGLGWLHVAETMQEHLAELTNLADEVKNAGFEFVVVLGMGGSSLSPEVLSRTFGRQDDYPQLYVLDSTVPTAIRHMEQNINIGKTLFVVATKSSATTEPQMFHRYFRDRVKRVKGETAGENFIAITDPGSQLIKDAAHGHFRRVFLNMPDISGPYSALSYFGMAPFALMGGDVKTVLDRAVHAMQSCGPETGIEQNPGARLGATLASLSEAGRNKLTLVTSPSLTALGSWIEHLISESTGKEGKGLVPITGEPLASPATYGDDRIFAYIHTASDKRDGIDPSLAALEAAGHPVLRHTLRNPLDLGEEFFLWEFATATAAALLAVDPFDQPDMQEAKDNSKRLLAEYAQNGSLPQQKLIVAEESIRVFGDPETCDALRRSGSSLQAIVTAHLARLSPGDYFAITPYIEPLANYDSLLQQIRLLVRDHKRVATTIGYGPRFLHATGQLHKGGPATGLFLQVTAEDINDIEIPGEKFSFGVVKQAQALGDFEALSKRQRRALRIDLGRDIEKGLRKLLALVKVAVSAPPLAATAMQK